MRAWGMLLLLLWMQPGFEVASIRESRLARAGGEGSRREHIDVSPAGVRLINASLSDCIQWAYHVRFYQVVGPDWIIQQRYDILAKAGPTAGHEQMRAMMRSLLEDRFGLKVHPETRMKPVYALVVRSNREKLRPSGEGEESGTRVVDGSFVFAHVTMPEFAERLSDLAGIGRPVEDQTGVRGVYDITLPSAARDMREDPGSIFTALDEAGFKLEPRKGPMEVLVVDHAERPSAN